MTHEQHQEDLDFTPGHDEDAPEPVEPEYTEADPDPVTARNTDPAAMSEAERNRRLTETYETPTQ